MLHFIGLFYCFLGHSNNVSFKHMKRANTHSQPPIKSIQIKKISENNHQSPFSEIIKKQKQKWWKTSWEFSKAIRISFLIFQKHRKKMVLDFKSKQRHSLRATDKSCLFWPAKPVISVNLCYVHNQITRLPLKLKQPKSTKWRSRLKYIKFCEHSKWSSRSCCGNVLCVAYI